MPTIIDSLIVTLGLRSSDFSKGASEVDSRLGKTGRAADDTGKKLNDAGKKGAEGFGALAESATKFLAVIGGTMAVKRFVEQTIESSAALNLLSKNLGESAERISALSNAAEIAGGSASGLQGTLDMLSRAQTELQITGQSSLVPYFAQLGIAMADANGKARNTSDMLLDLSDRLRGMDRTTANNLGRMMGLDQGTMNLLLRGRSEVELMIRRQEEYGAVTKRQAEESGRLRESITRSRQSFEAFGRELVSQSMPILEKLFAYFESFGGWLKDNQEAVKIFLGTMAAGLVAVGLAITPLNLTIAAITGVSAAIALLYQDYLTWKRGGETFVDWAKWEPGIKAAGDGIRGLKSIIEDMVYRSIAAVDMLSAIWDRDWSRAKFAAGEFLAGKGEERQEQRPENLQPGPATRKEAQKQAVDYFVAQGWRKEQAAGLAANIAKESGFNPAAVGDKGQAYGIAQWHPDRQAEFERVFKKPIQGSSFADQLAFMQYELTQGRERAAGQRLKSATTPEAAAEVVSRYYERPKKADEEAASRGVIASQIFSGMPGASSAASAAESVRQSAAMPSAKVAPAQTNVSNSIGEIKVYTQATDAAGIAKDLRGEIDYLLTANANNGLF